MRHCLTFTKLLFIICAFLTFECKGQEFILEADSRPLHGEWQGFIANRNHITFRTEYRYLLKDDGTWSILTATDTAPQGWYRRKADVELLLQPHEAIAKDSEYAIFASCLSDTQFSIPVVLDSQMQLIFVKTESLQELTPQLIAGTWRIKQKDLATDEIREAPFQITFKQDSYIVTLPNEAPVTADYTIKDGLIHLLGKPRKGEFWKAPTFFYRNGTLVYNVSTLYIWAERVSKE